ncbi:MAG: CRISPR-associated endonuclease Cas2 [Wujia sp.]
MISFVILNKAERKELTHTLHNACIVNGTKTEYTKLRKFLHKDGYIRIAPEVFMRIVANRKAAEKHYRRIEQFAPKTVTVRLLRLTEKQYQNIYMVSGEAVFLCFLPLFLNHIFLYF